MTTFNTVIKKRNSTNDGWDSILPITTAENVLINEQGDTVATHMADGMPHLIQDITSNKTYRYGLQIQNGVTQFIYEEVV